MSHERGATAVRDNEGLTITVHLPANQLANHHPSNFTGAEWGLCQMGLSLCMDTADARHVLRDLERENREARTAQPVAREGPHGHEG